MVHIDKETLAISILVDEPNSWIHPFVRLLKERITVQFPHKVVIYSTASAIPSGDMLFILGCTSMISQEILQRNTHNLVIHESDLPQGRGWSPISWQVQDGQNRIPVVLFEASMALDAGPIYIKDYIELDGTELLPGIKQKQGEKTIELVCRFLEQWPHISQTPQKGKASYYPRRTRQADELDIQKTIAEQFNHLRIVHNENYPAWFVYNGERYLLKIFKMDVSDEERIC